MHKTGEAGFKIIQIQSSPVSYIIQIRSSRRNPRLLLLSLKNFVSAILDHNNCWLF